MNQAVTQTSIDAYYQLDLTNQQRDVLKVLEVMRESCIADIAEFLNWQRSTVSGRLNELKQAGVIIMTGKQPSKTTGIRSEFWRLKNIQTTLF